MSSLKGRITRLELLGGSGSGVATVRVHFAAVLPPVRRAPGPGRGVFDLAVKGDNPFSRLHVLAKRPTPESDRRPGEPTVRRAGVILGRLMPYLDGRQRRLAEEAGFVVVV